MPKPASNPKLGEAISARDALALALALALAAVITKGTAVR